MRTLLPSRPFNEAKTQLSDVMSQVVRGHHPFVVDRNRGKEQMVLMEAGDLLRMLESFSFAAQVSVSDGEFIARLPVLKLTAGGETLDEALDELVEVAEEYAQLLLERPDFYLQTDRAAHLPWALRLALTPPDQRRQLVAPEPPARGRQTTVAA